MNCHILPFIWPILDNFWLQLQVTGKFRHVRRPYRWYETNGFHIFREPALRWFSVVYGNYGSSHLFSSGRNSVCNFPFIRFFKSIDRIFHYFNCRPWFRTFGPHQCSAKNKKNLQKIDKSALFKDVAYSPEENNGQNSFYKNFLVVLHVNAP